MRDRGAPVAVAGTLPHRKSGEPKGAGSGSGDRGDEPGRLDLHERLPSTAFWLGNRCYSLYLTHYRVIRLADEAFARHL